MSGLKIDFNPDITLFILSYSALNISFFILISISFVKTYFSACLGLDTFVREIIYGSIKVVPYRCKRDILTSSSIRSGFSVYPIFTIFSF